MRQTSAPELRVALFSGNYNYTLDGANLVLNRWVDHIERARGCRVRVYSPTDGSPAFGPAGALVTTPSMEIPLRAEYRLALGISREARADLDSFRPHLFHVSAPDPLGWHALAVARSLKLPVVGSYHTRFETYLRYYGLGALAPAVGAMVRAFYARCDLVLAPSRAVADELAGKWPPGRVRLWGRGVDKALFNPGRRSAAWRAERGFASKDLVLLFFGRLVKEKGLRVFARAATAAVRADPRIRLLVIGDGPARDRFARRLPPAAVFTGTLEGEALATAVASADILLNPSLTEAFSNVTLEAMACGLAIVAAATPVQRDLVARQAGILCWPTDAEGFASAVLLLAREPDLRARLGSGARAASEAYSWAEVLERAEAAYAAALNLGSIRSTRPPAPVRRPAQALPRR